MYIYPAIDLVGGKAVRLYQGDYARMTVYQDNPLAVAKNFQAAGARHIHLVDLEGAKSGKPENLHTIREIVTQTDLFVEVGGGIRNLETVETYLAIGVDRVILGTAAVTNPDFLQAALERYGEKIAVGVDLKDGYVAIHGWTQTSNLSADAFFSRLEKLGVKTVICTDISKDGVMQGTNLAMYRDLADAYHIDLIASGGVSSLADVEALRKLNLHGAIVGKAYYLGAIDLREAIEVAK